jgi:hypothetical protein
MIMRFGITQELHLKPLRLSNIDALRDRYAELVRLREYVQRLECHCRDVAEKPIALVRLDDWEWRFGNGPHKHPQPRRKESLYTRRSNPSHQKGY